MVASEALDRLLQRTGPAAASSTPAQRAFAAWLREFAGSCLYPGAPISRADFAVGLLVKLLPGAPDAQHADWDSLAGLLLTSPFDHVRACALRALEGGAAPGGAAWERRLERWRAGEPWDRLMRRDADAGALLLRLVGGAAAGQG